MAVVLFPYMGSSLAMGADRIPDEGAAHDVLAAEAFAVPAPDPELRHRPVVLPEDPSGVAEPHDILAAEEFAMPAVTAGSGSVLTRATDSSWPPALGVAVALLALVRLRRRR